VYRKLGLTWTEATDRFLTDHDRPSDGLRPFRVTREQPERWRSRLTAAQVDEIQDILARFPRRGWVWTPGRDPMAR
jgi:hypothetical protein